MFEAHCSYIPQKELLLEKTIGDLAPRVSPSLKSLPLCSTGVAELTPAGNNGNTTGLGSRRAGSGPGSVFNLL